MLLSLLQDIWSTTGNDGIPVSATKRRWHMTRPIERSLKLLSGKILPDQKSPTGVTGSKNVFLSIFCILSKSQGKRSNLRIKRPSFKGCRAFKCELTLEFGEGTTLLTSRRFLGALGHLRGPALPPCAIRPPPVDHSA